MICVKHNQLFHVGSSCELCNSISESPQTHKQGLTNYSQTTPNPVTPLSVMETKKSKKGVSAEISYGNGYIHTEKVINSLGMVIKLKESGYNQAQIAMKLGVSQPYVCKVLKTFNKNINGNKQRFHNFSIKYDADFDFEKLPFEIIRLNKFSVYKYYKDVDFKIQFFKNKTIVVRTTKDIFHEDIVKTQDEAIRYVTDFLLKWNKFNICFLKYEVISGHNAFLDNAIAKDVQLKGEKIKYLDKTDNKVRTSVDLSKGVPEFEHEHSKHFVSDSKKWEGIINDVATDNYYPLSETKEKINLIMVNYVNSVQEQTKANLWMAENFKSHKEVLEGIGSGINKLSEGINELRGVVSELKEKEDKKIKAQKINKWREDNDLR